MGRSTTPKYVVKLFVRGFHYTPSAWRVRAQGRVPGLGQPTDERLADYVRDFEEDCRSGANKHLGPQTVYRAYVKDQFTDEVVARYESN